MGIDYREMARAFKEDWNPKTDDSTVAMLAAFGKEVAEEAGKENHCHCFERQVMTLQEELESARANLAAFTSATPDSPEVKEALKCVESTLAGDQSMTPSHCAKVLACALRAAMARLAEAEKELERERMRLAACGVAASEHPFKGCSPEYESASLHDVIRTTAKIATLTAALSRAREELEYAWREFDNHGGTVYRSERNRQDKAMESFRRIRLFLNALPTPPAAEGEKP